MMPIPDTPMRWTMRLATAVVPVACRGFSSVAADGGNGLQVRGKAPLAGSQGVAASEECPRRGSHG